MSLPMLEQKENVKPSFGHFPVLCEEGELSWETDVSQVFSFSGENNLLPPFFPASFSHPPNPPASDEKTTPRSLVTLVSPELEPRRGTIAEELNVPRELSCVPRA